MDSTVNDTQLLFNSAEKIVRETTTILFGGTTQTNELYQDLYQDQGGGGGWREEYGRRSKGRRQEKYQRRRGEERNYDSNAKKNGEMKKNRKGG